MGVAVGDWRKATNCSEFRFDSSSKNVCSNGTKYLKYFLIFTAIVHSSAMSEEPEILLQHASLQPHMPLPVWTRPPLWTERCSSGRLRLSGGNSPEPRKHLHSKGGVCLPLLRWNHATGSGRYWWTPVVSWSSWDLYWLNVLILTLYLFFFGGGSLLAGYIE